MLRLGSCTALVRWACWQVPNRPLPAVMPPPFTWTGLCIGANLGDGWAHSTLNDSFTGISLGNERPFRAKHETAELIIVAELPGAYDSAAAALAVLMAASPAIGADMRCMDLSHAHPLRTPRVQ
jgi:hypothetical protein